MKQTEIALAALAAIVAVLILVFVILPYSNFAVFDSQCKRGGCSGQVCSANADMMMSICDFPPEYMCLKDCKVRNFQCGFDPEFEQNCISCIKNCKNQPGLAQNSCFENCANK